MDDEIISNLFTHMQWADTEVWKVIKQSPNVENDKKIKSLLYHIHLVQFLFFQIWKNEEVKYAKVEEFENLEALKNWSIENYKYINDFLNNITEEKLNDVAQIPWSKKYSEKIGKDVPRISIKGSMLQVVSHSTHHRAQLNMKLKKLGCAPPMVDFIVWLWEGKPHIL